MPGTLPTTGLRILLFYDCVYPESLGGVEHRNAELGRALAERGHEVVLAGWASQPSRPHPNVEIRPVGQPGELYTRGGQRSTAQALRLALHAARLDLRGIDLVETANIPYVHLPFLAWNCGRYRVPLVVSWYEYWGRYWQRYLGAGGLGRALWWVYALIERAVSGVGDSATACSQLTGKRVQRRRRDPVTVLPCGIPFERIRAAVGGTRASGPALVYAGRLMKEKRLELLLEAVGLLEQDASLAEPRDDTEPTLLLVGDGPARSDLEALSRQLGIAHRVRFAGRLPTNDEVWRAVASARIAVQPSEREGFGLFPLEAMAAGLPLVHCRSSESAVDELARDDVEGYGVAPRPDVLADVLGRLLKDPERLERLSRAAVTRAASYDWSRVALQMEQIAAKVLDRAARTRASA